MSKDRDFLLGIAAFDLITVSPWREGLLRIADKLDAMERAEKDLPAFKARVAEIGAERDAAREDRNSLSIQWDGLRGQVDDLQAEAARLRNELIAVHGDLAELVDQHAAIKRDRVAITGALTDAIEQRDKAEQERDNAMSAHRAAENALAHHIRRTKAHADFLGRIRDMVRDIDKAQDRA